MIFNVSGGGGGTGGTLTVNAPAGVTATIYKADKNQTKIVDSNGYVVFKRLETGTWTLTITDGEQTATKSVMITADYSAFMSFNRLPDFTYTGDFEIVNDEDEVITVSQDDWKIRFLTSGTLTFTALNGAEDGIDVFLVGGGGGGGNASTGTSDAFGGGGGYTTTEKSVPVVVGEPYEIIVGAGGSAATDGGSTSAFSVSADGGKAGSAGGAGGSGGGGIGGVGGSDGSNGGNNGGSGQGTTTMEFGESNATLYAGGGGGGISGGTPSPVPGGDGGGGAGSHQAGMTGQNGTDNLGGGGGGGSAYGGSASGGAGGSGIVIIRNAREVA